MYLYLSKNFKHFWKFLYVIIMAELSINAYKIWKFWRNHENCFELTRIAINMPKFYNVVYGKELRNNLIISSKFISSALWCLWLIENCKKLCENIENVVRTFISTKYFQDPWERTENEYTVPKIKNYVDFEFTCCTIELEYPIQSRYNFQIENNYAIELTRSIKWSYMFNRNNGFSLTFTRATIDSIIQCNEDTCPKWKIMSISTLHLPILSWYIQYPEDTTLN